MRNLSQKGFTLIELSIVLLIISLITGGIIAGRSLVHSARLTSVIDDVNKYQTAVRAFELEYNALPGDFDKATKFWPGQTYSGDGNGQINGTVSGVTTEQRVFFEHLSLAGVVEGSFSSTATMEIGISHPKTAFEGATFQTAFISRELMFSFAAPNTNPENTLFYMKTTTNANSLSPVDAYTIDLKLDDGMPGTGKMTITSLNLIMSPFFPLCAKSHTEANRTTTKYDLSITEPSCIPIFPIQ